MPKVYGCPCNASRIFSFRFRQCAPRRSRPASRPGALPSVGKAGQPSWAGAPAACSGRSAAMGLAACGGRRADLADEACAGKELKEEAPFLGTPWEISPIFSLSPTPRSSGAAVRRLRAWRSGLRRSARGCKGLLTRFGIGSLRACLQPESRQGLASRPAPRGVHSRRLPASPASPASGQPL